MAATSCQDSRESELRRKWTSSKCHPGCREHLVIFLSALLPNYHHDCPAGLPQTSPFTHPARLGTAQICKR
eukprot:5317243-Amphidinium_carterae.1